VYQQQSKTQEQPMTFDPKRPLVMASFKTVLGHNLPVGTPLVITDEPSAPGEVDEGLARRLWNGKAAAYATDLRPTPVETPEQERARLALEAMRDGNTEPTADLLVWQEDDAEAGKKAGAKVTKDDLLIIAARESVTVETDDNKPDLIRKITERRAQAALDNATNAESRGTGDQGLIVESGATTAGDAVGADTGVQGDAHGLAGEGAADSGSD
jgi:hypothetical protein